MRSSGGREPIRYDWEQLWRMVARSSGLGPWRVSEWDGHCRGCGAHFRAGELIRFYEPESGWLAECCGVDPLKIIRCRAALTGEYRGSVGRAG